jgi:glycosyltransferase A (GT-A) superfamily protein (DUF2064 family)
MSGIALVVLMRWPRPGEGKTRLAAEIGVADAHALHRCFVADTLGWPAPRPRLLAVSPDASAVTAARAAAPDACVVPQASGHLGLRIAGALHAAFNRGARFAVLVGTDSPSLPHELVMKCAAAAGRAGVAMVPATDGGFVALAVAVESVRAHGLEWLCDEDIAWSTDRAANDTQRSARRHRLEPASTSPWYDVDTAHDLDRLHNDLLRDPRRAPQTLRWLQEQRCVTAAPVERVS